MVPVQGQAGVAMGQDRAGAGAAKDPVGQDVDRAQAMGVAKAADQGQASTARTWARARSPCSMAGSTSQGHTTAGGAG